MSIVGYLDASGSISNPQDHVLTVGGFLALEDDWALFSEQWAGVLAAHGAPPLHMKEFAHSRGAFANWKRDESQRAALLRDLTAVIRAWTLTGVAASVLLGAYKRWNDRYQIREILGDPYCLAAGYAMSGAMEWSRREHGTRDLRFFIEKGDQGQGQLVESLKRMNVRLPCVPVLLEKTRTDARGQKMVREPFQAADFLAYEQTKGLTDWIFKDKNQMRMSMRQIMPRTLNREYRVIFDETFRSLCKIFSIPRR